MSFLKTLLSSYKQGLVIGAGLLLIASVGANYVQHNRYLELKVEVIELTAIHDRLERENKHTKAELALTKETWNEYSKSNDVFKESTSEIDSKYVQSLQDYYESEIARLTQTPTTNVIATEAELGLVYRPTQIGYDALWQQYCTMYTHVDCLVP